MKKKLILSAAIILCIAVGIFFIADKNDKLSYSKCVGEYEDTELINRCIEKGESYAIGVNSKGKPVFKDINAAFEQAKADYALGFEYLHKYEHLPEISRKQSVWSAYFLKAMEANPPMTVENYDIIKKQCIDITKFFDIYENSFKPAAQWLGEG